MEDKEFSQPISNGADIPLVVPSAVDARFYTKEYKFTNDDKRKLVALVARPEFRVFEKYMDWRINASAHRMKGFLMERKDNEAANESAAIDSLVKITQDMLNFWNEVKLMDMEGEIIIKEKATKSPRAFGDDRFSIDEAIGL